MTQSMYPAQIGNFHTTSVSFEQVGAELFPRQYVHWAGHRWVSLYGSAESMYFVNN